MQEKVKYAKRFYNKETGDHEFKNKRNQVRDFGATTMTKAELERGVKRALKRGSHCQKLGGIYLEKVPMYLAQAKAYEARVEWYES
jgi:nitric oxide synthase oxygenase domain/subunit